MEPEAGAPRIDRRSVAPLLPRRDAPALARLAIQGAAFLAAAAAAFRLGAAGSLAAPLAVLAAGLTLAPFFAVLHEAGHRTAFRTPVLNHAAAWDARFPFVRREERARVTRESRGGVLLWGMALAGALLAPAGAGWVLAAWPVAHGALGLYLMPEHTGLPYTGSQLERTRSMRTHAVVRWAMWNMPLHAEHHAFPAVPFHALPRLHGLLRPHPRHRSSGYLAFHGEALRRAAGRAP